MCNTNSQDNVCIIPIKVLFEADTQQSLSPLPCLFRPDQLPAGAAGGGSAGEPLKLVKACCTQTDRLGIGMPSLQHKACE